MNTHKIFSVALYEFRTNVRRWGYRLATFGLPLLAALILWGVRALGRHADLGAMLTGNLDRPIAVLDQAGLLPSELPQPFVRVEQLEAGKDGVRAERYLALVVVPADYATNHQVTVYSQGGMASNEVVLQQLPPLFAYAALHGAYSYDEVLRLWQGPAIRLVSLSKGAGRETHSSERMVIGYALGMLFFMALFSSSGYLLHGVAQEKESHVIELLLSSLNPRQLLWGKVLGLGAVGLLQVTVWLVSAWLLIAQAGDMGPKFLTALQQEIRHPDPQWIVAVLVVLPLSYLVYALLMAGFGALGSNLRESQQFAVAVSMTATIPFMLNPLFFLNPQGVIPRALSYFPLTAPVATVLRLGVASIPWWDLGLSLLGLAVGVLFSVWLGVRLFRVGVLMSGKRPSWREVWRIIRNPA